MRSTLINLSKRLTIPRLSPSHTSARIVRFLAFNGQDVESYDPIMILECSPDLIHDPADRDFPDQKRLMFIETCDEGILKELNDHEGKWLDVGTPIGVVDDGDVVDKDWIWQAYLHEEKVETKDV
mmetsp:Transcript_9220/g.11623  ORF Transcript_9220/g.11623 Transcript_9220/m.11623 type:complete len:125 (-) Transcript_9220:590-964(-)